MNYKYKYKYMLVGATISVLSFFLVESYIYFSCRTDGFGCLLFALLPIALPGTVATIVMKLLNSTNTTLNTILMIISILIFYLGVGALIGQIIYSIKNKNLSTKDKEIQIKKSQKNTQKIKKKISKNN